PNQHPRLIVPEVVQTSAMDCGPASLKCVLEGFGIPVSYGRLREACQTDVDGTSIDTVEEVAMQLGLDAEQIMVPADYLLLQETAALPGFFVAGLSTGVPHFVVVWRRLGLFFKVMDPATGRRWPTQEQFLSSLYIHALPVEAASWLLWARSDQFVHPLRRKLIALGLTHQSCADLLGSAVEAEDWRPLATLEAATRTIEAMVCSGGLRRSKEATHMLEQLLQRASKDIGEGTNAIPTHYWSVRSAPPGPNGQEQVLLQG